ncbi:DinB family protein [Cyclobacteriaceae bacterium YHN15]|nr:DinB family protein [Cyclobacteriaceae bacterium YHN15]
MSEKINWILELDEISKEVKESFKELDKETIYRKPDNKNWSIAENLEHIMKVNNSYFPIFRKLKEGTFHGAFISKIGFFSKLFGNLIYKSVSDGGKKKVKTFSLWEPKIQDENSEIVEKFLSHQEELKGWIKEMEMFINKGEIIHSPANSLIVYSLPRALDIIVAHEKRHLDQARRNLRI